MAGVPGGAELLVAAGYEYQTCASGAATAAGAAGAAAEEEEELFLVHSMLPDGRGKLRYTLSRYPRFHIPAESSHAILLNFTA